MTTNVFICLAILAWGIGAVFTKVAASHLHPLMMALVAEIFYIIFVPIAIVATKTPIQLNSSGFIFGFISAACMGAGSLAYYFALQKGAAGTVAAATSVYPVLTVIVSVIFLSEDLSLKKIIGCLLAVAAVFLITQK